MSQQYILAELASNRSDDVARAMVEAVDVVNTVLGVRLVRHR